MGQQFKVVGMLHWHGWVCWLCGRLVGGAWCGSLPNYYCPYPSSSGTVVEILGSRSTTSGGPWHFFLQDNGEVGDTNGSRVVHLDGRAWLRPTHFDEGLMEGGHFLGCGVENTKFGFGGRRHNKLHYLGDQENQTVVLGEGVIFGDEDVGTGLTVAL
jgi:hypothetical protein